jgi:pyridoxine 5-phosphate synthase
MGQTDRPRTKLSVNVNKIATLRNSRGKNNPDVVKMSLDIVRFGAEGITVHPRPDERHIRKTDVYALRPQLDQQLNVEFNIEGYPSEDFLKMVCEIRADQCTLVPDPPEALTSNAGWNVLGNAEILKSATAQLHAHKVRVSVFVDPRTTSENDYKLLQEFGVDRVELYTEEYAESFGTPRQHEVIQVYKRAAEYARRYGLGVNAGHDLNTDNLRFLVQEIPFIEEVSIGHALIADALYWGMELTIQNYLDCLRT